MAVNILAKRLAAPAAQAMARRNKTRLAPPPIARPQDAAAPPPAQVPALVRRNAHEVRRREALESMPDRRWLGMPRMFRLPNLSLPRLNFPPVGAPHWQVRVPQLPVGELAELGAGAAQLLTLWNGPNVEDIRRFEGDGSQAYGYGWFQSLLTECARAKDDAGRQAFLEAFSTHGSPKLTDELAALEYFCMKTAYLRLQVGDRHRFCCADYGWQTVATAIRDFETGLVAHVLVPDEAAAQVSEESKAPSSASRQKPPVLIVFRGTARATSQPESEFAERPTGCQADLDWVGIGYSAFAANEDKLLKLVRRYMKQGHRIILAGHSLGGVFAARTMCALTPQEQLRTQLRTFNASGLDPATQQRGVARENNVMVRHRDDKLPRAGGLLLDGTLVTTEPQNEVETLYPHGMPLLAANALNGHPAKFTRKDTEAGDMSPTLELGRKFLCLIAHDRVEV